jgi:hypothetical protein
MGTATGEGLRWESGLRGLVSMKCGWQSTERYTYDGRLIGRGAQDDDLDGDTRGTQDLSRFGPQIT